MKTKLFYFLAGVVTIVIVLALVGWNVYNDAMANAEASFKKWEQEYQEGLYNTCVDTLEDVDGHEYCACYRDAVLDRLPFKERQEATIDTVDAKFEEAAKSCQSKLPPQT